MQAFSHHDRKLLLGIGGLGPQCISRLEEVGIDSLQSLRRIGADRATALICTHLGTTAWRNRRRSIERALEAIAQRPGAEPSHGAPMQA